MCTDGQYCHMYIENKLKTTFTVPGMRPSASSTSCLDCTDMALSNSDRWNISRTNNKHANMDTACNHLLPWRGSP